ncbi:MAG: MarR family transcriptional regulator [Propionicimonas sp.]|uniref:MarR family winged helix-turn-helix transcriptional regulator n=1 Tax=Propionicimonas sp. TaxID=1955623 RepID=UPI003D102CCA
MRSLPELGLDDERAALADELFALNLRVHDRAMGLVGMPAPPDLTMQQLRVLGHVAQQPGISGNELGRLLGVSAPTASGLVERLVEKGLVSRVDDADDRRVRRLHATEAGLDVMRDMDSMFGRALGVVLTLLSAADLTLLCQGSRAMLDALDRAHALQSGG